MGDRGYQGREAVTISQLQKAAGGAVASDPIQISNQDLQIPDLSSHLIATPKSFEQLSFCAP